MDPPLILGVSVTFLCMTVTSGGLVVITGDLVIPVVFGTRPGPACVSVGSLCSLSA